MIIKPGLVSKGKKTILYEKNREFMVLINRLKGSGLLI